MKNIFYILVIGILLGSCVQEDFVSGKGIGRLALGDVTIALPDAQLIETKSVDSDLIIQIKGSSVSKKYVAGQTPAIISLPVGSYTLEAFTDDYESWQNGAVYYSSQSFEITEGNTTSLQDMQVPMLNCGIQFVVESGLPFSNYRFNAKAGEDNVTTNVQYTTIYFPVSAIGKQLSYSLSAKNAVGESVTVDNQSGNAVTLAAGKIYKVVYNLATGVSEIYE